MGRVLNTIARLKKERALQISDHLNYNFLLPDRIDEKELLQALQQGRMFTEAVFCVTDNSFKKVILVKINERFYEVYLDIEKVYNTLKAACQKDGAAPNSTQEFFDEYTNIFNLKSVEYGKNKGNLGVILDTTEGRKIFNVNEQEWYNDVLQN